jgi:hypothetical protein
VTVERCAVKVVDGAAVEIIVGEADWAAQNLGGEWVQVESNYDNPESFVGFGDLYDAETGTFTSVRNVEQKVAAHESAIQKLLALGITADEARLLLP